MLQVLLMMQAKFSSKTLTLQQEVFDRLQFR